MMNHDQLNNMKNVQALNWYKMLRNLKLHHMLFKVGQPSILIWLLRTDYNHCNNKHCLYSLAG